MLGHWKPLPTDSAFAPQVINPDVTIGGLRVVGSYAIADPGTPTVTADGLIFFDASRFNPTSRKLCTSRIKGTGTLIYGGTTVANGAWVRRPLQLAHDLFVAAGADELSLILRSKDADSDVDTIAVASTLPLAAPYTPIVTPNRHLVVATMDGTVQAYKVERDRLTRTGLVTTNSDGGGTAPFQLDNGLIISAAHASGQASIIATSLGSDGTLHRMGDVMVGPIGNVLRAPGNHLVHCDKATHAVTVFHADATGRFSRVDAPSERLEMARLVVNADGHGIAGSVDPQVFAPVRFSDQGKLDIDMKQSFTSTTFPILTRSGTLVRTSSTSVFIEDLTSDGALLVRDTTGIRRVVATKNIAVTPSGVLLVPTQYTLVALGTRA